MNAHLWQHIIGCLLSLIIGLTTASARELRVPISSGDEIVVEQYPASGKYLVLWFAPEYGLHENHRALAQKLAGQNIEVWLSNLLDSLFLPVSTNSIKQLSGEYVADLIEQAHKLSGKKIILAGDSYAAVLALRGIHSWQQRQNPVLYLIGGILFSPYTYSSIPQLGQSPDYLPIVSATNVPLMIYQAKSSAVIGQFKTLLELLQQNGNPIYTYFMPDIMSLFYQKEPTSRMKQQAEPLPTHIRKMIAVLEQHPFPAGVIPLQQPAKSHNGIDIELKRFTGKDMPLAIELPDINGNVVRKADFKGRVTVLNFWATWCPPCIEEIPSLNRLKNKMRGLPFEILSINYAEDKQSIRRFMKSVPIDFPVLLDRDGKFATQWNVISYPSTFIINPQGKIIYGVNAAIEWDNPEVVKKIKSLLKS